MYSVEVTAQLSAAKAQAVDDLIKLADVAAGYRPVSDQFWLELTSPSEQIRVSITNSAAHQLVGYAQVSVSGPTPALEMVFAPTAGDELSDIARHVLRAVTAVLRDRGDASLDWLAFAPGAQLAAVAAEFRLSPTRRLFQMYRSLPTGMEIDLITRPFEPGLDEAAWLRVNQRAFAWNPQQGAWSLESLCARESEPWFDPAGFLLHERQGRLAGFCWTKVHVTTGAPLGEIYVIAVDPDFHGLGLGQSLTLAGLEHLSSRGITTAMLFVDADNTAAATLYDKLGFVVHRTDYIFHGDLR